MISPLRDGASLGVVVGAEDLSVPPTSMEPLSTPICVSMLIPVFTSMVGSDPKWLEREARRQMKSAKMTLDADYSGPIYEIERQLRIDGDADSWWVAEMIPKK